MALTALNMLAHVARPVADPFTFASLAGALCELSGPAVVTAAVSKMREAQLRGEPVAWVARPDSMFFPPDVQQAGVDLQALVVVRVPGEASARAAELLVRSGGFGLIVIDLEARQRVPTPLLSRLLGLAQKHEVAVLFMSQSAEDAGSIDSLISMRAHAATRRQSKGRFVLTVRAIKDKRRSPTWVVNEEHRGPSGLR